MERLTRERSEALRSDAFDTNRCLRVPRQFVLRFLAMSCLHSSMAHLAVHSKPDFGPLVGIKCGFTGGHNCMQVVRHVGLSVDIDRAAAFVALGGTPNTSAAYRYWSKNREEH